MEGLTHGQTQGIHIKLLIMFGPCNGLANPHPLDAKVCFMMALMAFAPKPLSLRYKTQQVENQPVKSYIQVQRSVHYHADFYPLTVLIYLSNCLRERLYARLQIVALFW